LCRPRYMHVQAETDVKMNRRPALTILNSPIGVLLAWTGTDANHSLNVLPIAVSDSGALVPGTKTILSQFSSWEA
jgi:hypothetical protein